MSVIRIEISEAKPRRGSTRYSVRLADTGETLIERARDPEFEAARILLARGFDGILETVGPGSSVVSLRIPLAKAARLTTIEPNNAPSTIRKYQPFEVPVLARGNV